MRFILKYWRKSVTNWFWEESDFFGKNMESYCGSRTTLVTVVGLLYRLMFDLNKLIDTNIVVMTNCIKKNNIKIRALLIIWPPYKEQLTFDIFCPISWKPCIVTFLSVTTDIERGDIYLPCDTKVVRKITLFKKSTSDFREGCSLLFFVCNHHFDSLITWPVYTFC